MPMWDGAQHRRLKIALGSTHTLRMAELRVRDPRHPIVTDTSYFAMSRMRAHGREATW
jgi:hypothetical protein